MTNVITIPIKDKMYYPWGNYDLVSRIIKSEKFYPTWVVGEKGCGKTAMIEQACAELKRKFVRVNFTSETDETQLIGGKGLRGGDTFYEEGILVRALREGAVVLLDEVSAAHTNRILCLQSILEGNGVLIKDTAEWVKPAQGFQIFATDNTKGLGSDDGQYIGVSIMNGAFLDRFAAMIEQTYPSEEVEKFILSNYYINYCDDFKNIANDKNKDEKIKAGQMYIIKLLKWAGHVRDDDNFSEHGATISTRTLINIIQGFAILGNELEPIQLACNRSPIGESLYDIYEALNGAKVEVRQAKTYRSTDEFAYTSAIV